MCVEGGGRGRVKLKLGKIVYVRYYNTDPYRRNTMPVPFESLPSHVLKTVTL